MIKIIVGLVAILTTSVAVACTYSTLSGPNGKTIYCTTCCVGNICNTTCI